MRWKTKQILKSTRNGGMNTQNASKINRPIQGSSSWFSIGKTDFFRDETLFGCPGLTLLYLGFFGSV